MPHSSKPDFQAPDHTSEYNLMQTVKRRFFAMRNGALAAQMRAAGLDYRINFGLNTPQIKDIAAEINAMGLASAEQLSLADSLWANATTRESRLIAPLIHPADLMSTEKAAIWMRQSQTTEISDHLCHSLLRHLPGAADMAETAMSDSNASDINRYTALRLVLNLLLNRQIGTTKAHAAATAELHRDCRLTRSLARQILSEIEFLEE